MGIEGEAEVGHVELHGERGRVRLGLDAGYRDRGPDGQLWLLDYNNYLVRSNRLERHHIHTRVGLGELGDSPDTMNGQLECPALQAKFFQPHAGHGLPRQLSLPRRVARQLDQEGGPRRPWRSPTSPRAKAKRTFYTGDGGPALMATVDLPASVTVAPNGDVVFMDQANQVIRSVDASGTINRIAGTCLISYYDIGEAPCTKGSVLQQCSSLGGANATSNKATYCIPDTNNTLDEICGWACEPSFSGDGSAALDMHMAQSFGQAADPTGRIAYDPAGNLYFTDTLNNRIRKIDTNGMLSTIAGVGVFGVDATGTMLPTATGGTGGDGGPGHARRSSTTLSRSRSTPTTPSTSPTPTTTASARSTPRGSSPPWPATARRRTPAAM